MIEFHTNVCPKILLVVFYHSPLHHSLGIWWPPCSSQQSGLSRNLHRTSFPNSQVSRYLCIRLLCCGSQRPSGRILSRMCRNHRWLIGRAWGLLPRPPGPRTDLTQAEPFFIGLAGSQCLVLCLVDPPTFTLLSSILSTAECQPLICQVPLR